MSEADFTQPTATTDDSSQRTAPPDNPSQPEVVTADSAELQPVSGNSSQLDVTAAASQGLAPSEAPTSEPATPASDASQTGVSSDGSVEGSTDVDEPDPDLNPRPQTPPRPGGSTVPSLIRGTPIKATIASREQHATPNQKEGETNRKQAAGEMADEFVQIEWSRFMKEFVPGDDPSPEEAAAFLDFSKVRHDGNEVGMYPGFVSNVPFSGMNAFLQHGI